MRYDGSITVFLHGEAGQMSGLDQALQDWMAECPRGYKITAAVSEELAQMQRSLRYVENSCKDLPAAQIIVRQWECFSNLALVVLDFIDGLAHLRPQLEWLVQARISFSVTDTDEYYVYHSPAGEGGILPKQTEKRAGRQTAKQKKWDVGTLEDFIWRGKRGGSVAVSATLSAQDVHGTAREFDVLRLKTMRSDTDAYDRWDFRDCEAWEIEGALDAERDELVFCLSPDGKWKRVARWFRLEDDADTARLERFREKAAELAAAFRKKDPLWGFLRFSKRKPYPQEFGARLLELLLPRTQITVEQDAAGKLHYLDQKGKEYFFGRQQDFYVGQDRTLDIPESRAGLAAAMRKRRMYHG